MKLLITGGCVFLGSNFAADALVRGDELVIFDNLCRSGSRANFVWLASFGNFLFVHEDIRNPNDISRRVLTRRGQADILKSGMIFSPQLSGVWMVTLSRQSNLSSRVTR